MPIPQVVDDAQNSEPTSNMQLMNILPTFGIQLLPEQGLRIAGINIIGIHNGSTMDLRAWLNSSAARGSPLVIATHDIKQLEANPRTLRRQQRYFGDLRGKRMVGRSIYLYWHRWWWGALTG